MNDQNQDEKLEQNEELAKLRANTSIEKTILSKTLPKAPRNPKPRQAHRNTTAITTEMAR